MKVVLMDRDGTVIVEPPGERVDTVEKIQLFPDTIEALKYLAEHDYALILVTNQSGIAEGLMSEADFEHINAEVIKRFTLSGIKVLKTYMSPHGTNEVNEWRKPGPGMLQAAAKEFGLDLKNTWMVGDRASDVIAGVNAGTKTILVKTALKSVKSPEATYTAPNLLDAAKHIVSI